MGIFKRLGDNKLLEKVGKASGLALKAGAETFINPIGKAALVPFVSAAAGITGSKKSVETPFGEVKPFSELTPGQSLGLAAEIALAGPAGTASKIAKPITKAAGKVVKPLVKGAENVIRSSAAEDIYKAINPTTEANKKLVQKIAPEFAKRKIVGTRGQIISLAEQGMEEVGEQFNKLGELKGDVNLKGLEKTLKKIEEKAKVGGKVVDQNLYRSVNQVDSILRQFGEPIVNEAGAFAGQAFPTKLNAEKLKKIRQIFDKAVAESKGFQKNLKEGTELNIQKQASNAIRKILADKYPDFAKLNEEYSFYKTLNDVAEATRNRKVGQSGVVSKIGGTVMGGALGSLFGGVGTAGGAIAGSKGAEFFASPLFKTMSAATKTKLADALVSGEHSLPKIIDFISQRKAFGALKLKDFVQFLDSEASKLDQEEKERLEQEQEERIRMIQERIYGSDESDANEEDATNPIEEEPAQADTLPEPTPEIQMIIDRLSS